LEEIGHELLKLETRLSDLKQQKHSLFSQLKKVLNEDVIRRRNRDLQWTSDAMFADPMAPSMGLTFTSPQIPFNSNAFFAPNGHQIRPQNQTFKTFKASPSVARKRSHEQSRGASPPPPPPPNSYKNSCVTYTPTIGNLATNQSAYYGMLQNNRRF